MVLYNGFVFFPDDFRKVQYNISPFRGAEDLKILRNRFIASNKDGRKIYPQHTKEQFGPDFLFTIDGKSAIRKALEIYNLSQDDHVWIITTSNNSYISSCVTKQIEKFCCWSRVKTEQTKLIFVVHEFGSVYKDMESLLQYRIPIIEDCAMSMFSNDIQGRIGKYGDFTIYSLPKFFPVQFGGVLCCNKEQYKKELFEQTKLTDNAEQLLLYISEYHFAQKKDIIAKRRENYAYLRKRFKELNCAVELPINSNECPSVFMFNDHETDLNKLKVAFQEHGIESSIFYGRQAFFIPVHQNMELEDLDFMVELYKYIRYELQ